MPLDLDSSSTELWQQGRLRSQDLLYPFLFLIAVLYSNAIGSLFWLISGDNQSTNTVNLAIGMGILIAVVLFVHFYRWMEWEWMRTLVVWLVGGNADRLLQVLGGSIIGSIISTQWKYGSVENVLANAAPISVFAIAALLVNHYVMKRTKLRMAEQHRSRNPHLQPDEALEAVEQWEQHNRRVNREYSFLSMGIHVPTPEDDHHRSRLKPFPRASST